MRKVTYGVGCSLDGFITGASESLDWLLWSTDVQSLSAAYLQGVDTVLMGRKTWEAGLRHGGGPMPGKTTYVFSKTLSEVPAGVEIVSSDPGIFLRSLKQEEGREICLMGGGELAGALLSDGLIDEVVLNIHPVLLGSGTRLAEPLRDRVSLELVGARNLPHGCLYTTYRVKNPAAA